MNNKRAELTPIAFLISFLIIIVLGIVVITYTADTAEDIDVVITNNESSDIILTKSTQSLSNEDITSSEVKAYNNSWMEFDGVNDYIETDFSQSQNISVTEASSISGWIKFNHYGDSFYKTLFGQNGIFQMKYGSDNKPYLSWTNSSESERFYYFDKPNENEWVFYTLVYNGTHVFSYEGDTLKDTLIVVGSIRDDGQSYRISSSSSNTAYSTDELRMYNRSLSSSEVAQIYNAGRQANASLPSDGLVLWYSFDEQTGTIVHDKSGNGNHGE